MIAMRTARGLLLVIFVSSTGDPLNVDDPKSQPEAILP
jgi:hypothetical protein